MAASALQFQKLFLNYLCVAPVAEVLLDPSKIREPFIFLGSFGSYEQFYFKAFCAGQKAQRDKTDKKDNVKYPRQLFIRSVGELQPLAGHELRSQPFYRFGGIKNGNIAVILGNVRNTGWMLPLKVLPNWELQLDKSCPEYENISLHSSPLVRVYPFGMVSYQIRLGIELKNAIGLADLLSILVFLERSKAFAMANSQQVTLAGLIQALHRRVIDDIAGRNPDYTGLNNNFSPIHRIIALSYSEALPHPRFSDQELNSVIELDSQAVGIQQPASMADMGTFKCRYDDQFLYFHPRCTVIYAAKNSRPDPDFLAKCLRSNYTSILEAATIETHFSKTILQRFLNDLESLSRNTTRDNLDFAKNRRALLESVESSGLLSPSHELTKHYRLLYELVSKRFELQSNSAKNLNKIAAIKQALDPKLLSISEEVELRGIIAQLDDIAAVCRVFVDKNPLKLASDVNTARAIQRKSEDTRNSLQAALDEYLSLARQPYGTDQQRFQIKVAINQYVLSDFQGEILPSFAEFTKNVIDKRDDIKAIAQDQTKQGPQADKAGGAPIRSDQEIDSALDDAKSEVESAIKASSKAPDISTFATRAKPIVEKIVKGAKIVLSILGWLSAI